MAKLLLALVLTLAVARGARADDDLTANLLPGQAPFATGYWKETTVDEKSLKYGAHSLAGYALRFLKEPEKPQQPTIGRALGYKCLGTESYFVLYEEVSFPKPYETGVYKKICSLRSISGGVMTYVDVEADEYGRCDDLEDYLEKGGGRRLLGRRPGGDDDRKGSRRPKRRASTGTLVLLESPINSVLTTCTTTTFVPPAMTPLSTDPYPTGPDTPCTTYTYNQVGGPGNVQGLWVVGSKRSYVLESVSGFGSVSWSSSGNANTAAAKLSMNDGFYTASACPTVDSTPGIVASYTQSYSQRRYVDGTIDTVSTQCRIKYRDLVLGKLTVDSISQNIVENLPGDPDLTCAPDDDDDDDDDRK